MYTFLIKLLIKFDEDCIFCFLLQLIESAVGAIPEDLSLDSKLLVESQLLQATAEVKDDSADDGHIDSLDQMMCKIVDDMT